MAGREPNRQPKRRVLKTPVDDSKYEEVGAASYAMGVSGAEFVRQAIDEKLYGSIEDVLLERTIQRLAPVLQHPETQQLIRLLIQRHLRQ